MVGGIERAEKLGWNSAERDSFTPSSIVEETPRGSGSDSGLQGCKSIDYALVGEKISFQAYLKQTPVLRTLWYHLYVLVELSK